MVVLFHRFYRDKIYSENMSRYGMNLISHDASALITKIESNLIRYGNCYK
jgi:hypothetical protein